MGFWDSLGGAIVDAGKGLAEAGREMQSNKMKYESYSDDRLVSIIKDTGMFGSKTTERMAAMAVLKDRHGAEGAKEKIRNGY